MNKGHSWVLIIIIIVVYMHVHTHAHTHTHKSQKKSKQSLRQPLQNCCCPVNQHWMPGTTQTLKLCAANPPGAGLATHRRAVQVSRIEMAEPEIPQQLHTAKQDKDSWAFASPVYPLISQLGGLLPQLIPGHQFPFQQLGRLEQSVLAQVNNNTKVA